MLTNTTTYRAEEDSLDHEQDALERLNNASNNTARRSLPDLPDLPVEVWILILGFLPDLEDFEAAVYSSPKLFSLWYVAASLQWPI